MVGSGSKVGSEVTGVVLVTVFAAAVDLVVVTMVTGAGVLVGLSVSEQNKLASELDMTTGKTESV